MLIRAIPFLRSPCFVPQAFTYMPMPDLPFPYLLACATNRSNDVFTFDLNCRPSRQFWFTDIDRTFTPPALICCPFPAMSNCIWINQFCYIRPVSLPLLPSGHPFLGTYFYTSYRLSLTEVTFFRMFLSPSLLYSLPASTLGDNVIVYIMADIIASLQP